MPKIYLQPKYVEIKPPNVGAIMGETATTNISVENTFALSLTSNKSLTIALEATIPTHPPNAWKNLKIIRVSTDIAVAQAIEEIVYKPKPKYKGVLRPYFSNNGPYNNCPNEIPTKKEDKDSITTATVVCKLLAMLGNAGKYISIDNGPIEVSKPKIRIK